MKTIKEKNKVGRKKRILDAKKVFLFGIAIVLGAGTLNYLLVITDGNSTPHRNPIDTKISLYSDGRITPNAVATNPDFKHIAFDAPTPAKSSFFFDQLAAVARTIKTFAPDLQKEDRIEKEYGTWIWTPIMDMSAEYMESIISGAKKNGVNVIYASIDTYLDIFVLEKGEEKERRKKAFFDKLDDFIRRANRKGISVDAEAGWRNWAESDNAYKAFAVVNFARDFNATRKNKLRGFQYDVEPYLLDSYVKDKASVLKNFIELIDRTENFIEKDLLRFSVVVPDFYDGKDEATPKFPYNEEKDYTFGHLLKILERKPNSSIIVMSYRNFADGDDGAIEISNNEMQTGRNGAYQTKIIIAQETGNVPPPYVTFHSTSRKYLNEQVAKINAAFETYPNFGGIAVHYVNAFLALK